MRRLRTLTGMLAVPLLLVAGCRTATANQPVLTQPDPAPSTTPDTSGSSPIPSVTGRSGTSTIDGGLPDDGPAGVLAAIHTEHLADHDRVVFQFHGRTPPKVTFSYASRITEDPSDQPVPLLGKAFVVVVFHGGRLDTAPLESDPAKVVRYSGPTRLTPRYPVLQQLAVSGDFEAVLSFRLGLSAVAGLSTFAPAGSGSVVLDLWPITPATLV